MKTINGDIEHALASPFEEIDRLKSEVSRLTRLVEKKDAEIAELEGRHSKYEKPPQGLRQQQRHADKGQHGAAGGAPHDFAAQADREALMSLLSASRQSQLPEGYGGGSGDIERVDTALHGNYGDMVA